MFRSLVSFFSLVAQTIVGTLSLVKNSNWRLFNALNSSVSQPLLRILGNGKSLNLFLEQMDCNADYMVVNRHVMDDSYIRIKPKYYVLADPAFFTDENYIKYVRSIVAKTSWPMTLFIPSNAPLSINSQNPLLKIQRFNTNSFKGHSCLKSFFYKHNIAMPIPQNVIVACLYLSICMKYNYVELYGVEHSWTRALFVGNDNVVYMRDQHFNDEHEVPITPLYNDLHKPYKFHEILRDFAQMFASYWDIRSFADKANVQIINKTPSSYIDAFDKATI